MSISGVGGGAQLRSFQPPTFSSLDSDSSGGITLQELESAAPGGASDSKSTARAQKLFAAMDSDQNGSVSSSEKDAFDKKLSDQQSAAQFMAQLFGTSKAQQPSNQDVFAATDSNGDGSVSLDEFSSGDSADGISSDNLSKLFGMIDSNGDGSVSSTESSSFLDAVKSSVQSADQGGPQGAGGPPRGGPPPGGPPPGPPPGEQSADSTDSTSSTSAIDLLKIAANAYASSSSSTTTGSNSSATSSASNDLLSMLSSLLDKAA